ncbi:hypothetical protein LM604_08155, partial [Candidatus Acetothermia bacterium]|nr:hypothetical protein [Candidatus Acetothermia bacterium]
TAGFACGESLLSSPQQAGGYPAEDFYKDYGSISTGTASPSHFQRGRLLSAYEAKSSKKKPSSTSCNPS